MFVHPQERACAPGMPRLETSHDWTLVRMMTEPPKTSPCCKIYRKRKRYARDTQTTLARCDELQPLEEKVLQTPKTTCCMLSHDRLLFKSPCLSRAGPQVPDRDAMWDNFPLFWRAALMSRWTHARARLDAMHTTKTHKSRASPIYTERMRARGMTKGGRTTFPPDGGSRAGGAAHRRRGRCRSTSTG